MADAPDITLWLDSARSGDRAALDRVLATLYQELHTMARRQLAGQHGHTLDATALVHEAYLKLIGRREAQFLQPGDVTVAGVLKKAGYATGLIGKWGLGESDSVGAPWKQGFDTFFGFINQTHAHNHYPDFLWRNDTVVRLPNDITPIGDVPGAGYATKRLAYASDLFFEETRAFVQKNRAQPFFLFLALTTPHGNNERSRVLGEGNEVPDQGAYADRSWNDSQKNHAAMWNMSNG
mgnify:CR=1 FL=1